MKEKYKEREGERDRVRENKKLKIYILNMQIHVFGQKIIVSTIMARFDLQPMLESYIFS